MRIEKESGVRGRVRIVLTTEDLDHLTAVGRIEGVFVSLGSGDKGTSVEVVVDNEAET
jgi:hypothetical protein